MDGAYVLGFIAQRMRDLGFEHYTWKPVRVVTPPGLILEASNEYYYLVAKAANVPNDLTITSELDALTAADSANYADYNFYGVKEFTGIIKFACAAGVIDLEFIQVIPRIPQPTRTKAKAYSAKVKPTTKLIEKR